jgi:hypothetical protein
MLKYCNVPILSCLAMLTGLAISAPVHASGADDGKTRLFMRNSCSSPYRNNDPHCMGHSEEDRNVSTHAIGRTRPVVTAQAPH